MHAIGSDCKCNIGVRIDKKLGGRRIITDYVKRFAREQFEIDNGEVLFAQLNVIDTGAGDLSDAAQERGALLRVSTVKVLPIGDVAEQHPESIVAARSPLLAGPSARIEMCPQPPDEPANPRSPKCHPSKFCVPIH